MVMSGVGVKIDYLECAYSTRYYIINKINIDINAIHDQSLELTEFKGRFSPFDLDDLEARVCRLANGAGDIEDAVGQQNAPRTHSTDLRTLNMEEYEGMGFDKNNYSPIPTVSGESSKRITPRPTSTPKPEDELILNRSDPTDNRGKVNIVNSFEITQDRAATLLKMSKGGPIKNLGTKIQSRQSTSNQTESCRQQLGCTACGGCDHLRKDCHEDVFCNNCRTRSHATEMCRATSYQATGNSICIYCGSINHSSGKCHSKPNDNREEPRSPPRDLREQGPRINYNRMGHQPQVSRHQARINEGLNRQYSPNYINPYQSTLGSALQDRTLALP